MRALGWLLAVLLVAAPVVAVVNGWVGAERWPLRTLRVEGQMQRIDEAALRAAVLPHARRGFFAVDLDGVRTAVAALPWVEHAEVRKHWPDVIEVRVREHVPFARWGKDRLLSERGALFPATKVRVPDGLPLLDGPDPRAGEVATLYTEANDVMRATGQRLRALRMDDRGSWALQLADGTDVVLGRSDPLPRLRRFAPILPRLASARPALRVARADLRYTNGFALTWVARPPAPKLPAPVPAAAQGNA